MPEFRRLVSLMAEEGKTSLDFAAINMDVDMNGISLNGDFQFVLFIYKLVVYLA